MKGIRVPDGLRERWERLRNIKTVYDPGTLPPEPKYTANDGSLHLSDPSRSRAQPQTASFCAEKPGLQAKPIRSRPSMIQRCVAPHLLQVFRNQCGGIRHHNKESVSR